MSCYWRLDAACGNEYEHVIDAVRVLHILRDVLDPNKVVMSLLLGNRVLDIKLYMRMQNCRIHGKDLFVFAYIETTQNVVSDDIISYIAAYAGSSGLSDMRIKMELNNVRCTQLSCHEYEEQQIAFEPYLRTHNGINVP